MRLRLDPWAAEYNTALYAEPGASERSDLDLSVECPIGAWAPVAPQGAARVAEVVFLDGGRRVEARVLLEDDRAQVAFGALGSLGVGAVRCCDGERAAFLDLWRIDRVCALSGGRRLEDFALEPPPGGSGRLEYRVLSTPERDADAVVRRLQRAMLDTEAELTARLRDTFPDALIVCDGPRPFLLGEGDVLGYIKTIHDVKVPERELALVRTLEQGQRSPLYLLGSDDPGRQLFEWFLRLRDPRPWLYSLAGIVRLQAYAGPDPTASLARARALADWSCLALPAFASRQHQDPRAPQQLLPIRALEAELRRRMGHPQVVRRRVTRFLSQLEGTG